MVQAALGREANRILFKKLSKALLSRVMPNRRNNKALQGKRTETKNYCKQL